VQPNNTVSQKSMRTLILALFGLIAVAAYADDVKMVPFKIAGGQVVKCPCSDSGPLPAESGPYKMVGAGFELGPDSSGKHMALIFAFNLTVDKKGKPTHVLVEDVSGSSTITMVDDPSPRIEKKSWSGSAKPAIISESSTPWIFENKPTIMIFKVTISAKDTPDVVLYQPAYYPAKMKAAVAEFAKKNG